MNYEHLTQAEWRSLLLDARQTIPLFSRAVMRYLITGGEFIGGLALPQAGLDLVCPYTYSGDEPSVEQRLDQYHPIIKIAVRTGDQNAIDLAFDALTWQVPRIRKGSGGHGPEFVKHFQALLYLERTKEYARQLILDAFRSPNDSVFLAAVAVASGLEWGGDALKSVVTSLSERLEVRMAKYPHNHEALKLLAELVSKEAVPLFFPWLPNRLTELTRNSPEIWDGFVPRDNGNWRYKLLHLLMMADNSRDVLNALEPILPKPRFDALLRVAVLHYDNARSSFGKGERQMEENPAALIHFRAPKPGRFGSFDTLAVPRQRRRVA